MLKGRLTAKIIYPLTGTPSILTNVRQERVAELLTDWLRAQMRGQGPDEHAAEEREVYQITISVDLTEDTFFTWSDTGNEALTTGIVAQVIRLVESGQVLWEGAVDLGKEDVPADFARPVRTNGLSS